MPALPCLRPGDTLSDDTAVLVGGRHARDRAGAYIGSLDPQTQLSGGFSSASLSGTYYGDETEVVNQAVSAEANVDNVGDYIGDYIGTKVPRDPTLRCGDWED